MEAIYTLDSEPDNSSDALQYEGPGPADDRSLVYNHARNPLDIPLNEHAQLVIVGMDPQAIVADFGCNDAADSRRWRREFGHEGLLLAVDPYIANAEIYEDDHDRLRVYTFRGKAEERTFYIDGPEEKAEKTKTPVKFQLGEGDLDVVIANFSVYHFDDIAAAFRNFDYYLAAGGLLALATSGKKNKWFQRRVEEEAGKRLGLEPPEPFNTPYTAEQAEEDLTVKGFQIVISTAQQCPAYFTDDPKQIEGLKEPNLDDIRRSVISMLSKYKPIPGITKHLCRASKFAATVDEILQEELAAMKALTGKRVIIEHIDRRFYICRKLVSV